MIQTNTDFTLAFILMSEEGLKYGWIPRELKDGWTPRTTIL
jgi:hypothetical protein